MYVMHIHGVVQSSSPQHAVNQYNTNLSYSCSFCLITCIHAAGDECGQETHEMYTLMDLTQSSEVQFRVVQPDHGGGYCNCWGLCDFTVDSKAVNFVGYV